MRTSVARIGAVRRSDRKRIVISSRATVASGPRGAGEPGPFGRAPRHRGRDGALTRTTLALDARKSAPDVAGVALFTHGLVKAAPGSLQTSPERRGRAQGKATARDPESVPGHEENRLWEASSALASVSRD